MNKVTVLISYPTRLFSRTLAIWGPLAVACMLLGPALMAQPKIQLVNFASGFDLPVDIANCGDSRLFVVERDGVIWVLDSLGNRLDTFLNIDPRVNSTQNEQGLLGLAFDPNYAQNGYFYVDYSKNGTGDTRVARFSVKPGNPNEADPNSEFTILEQAQPYWNHNGGCLRFGPDGYLYISLGDGGSGGDPQNYGQNKKTFLGKILRIDVSNSSPAQPYTVPPDNPFVGNTNYFPEIWSLGWRNPWRFSFDALTGDMWIADVGQNLWEEVDFEPANTPGLNYGWRCYEGTHTYNTAGCQPASAYVSPFFEYSHSGANGCSVTGGFVYRGSKYPDLFGCYLFADYCSGRWWYTRRNANGTFSTNILANLGGYEFSSFGVDNKGELYVALLSSGKVQKIKELCSPFRLSLASIVDSSCANGNSGAIFLETSGGAGTVTYNWSNGGTGASLLNLNPGLYAVEAKDGNNCYRRDTFQIIDAGPDTPVLNASASVICFNGSVELTASNLSGPGTLTWYNGTDIIGTTTVSGTTAVLNIASPGNYAVQIDNTVCTAISEVVNIVQVGSVSPSLTASDTILCPNSTISLTASGLPNPNELAWYRDSSIFATTNGTDSVFSISVSEPGTYFVGVADSLCPTYSASVQVQFASVIVPELSISGDTVFSSLYCGICQWYFNGQPIDGSTSQYHIATESGTYSLIYTTTEGCVIHSGGVEVIIVETKMPASVRRFSLSPNPATASVRLELEFDKKERIQITLVDTNQRQVYTKTIDSQKVVLPISLSDLPTGNYFLQIQAESGSFVRKVVKQ